jgi:hypothetical protein
MKSRHTKLSTASSLARASERGVAHTDVGDGNFRSEDRL